MGLNRATSPGWVLFTASLLISGCSGSQARHSSPGLLDVSKTSQSLFQHATKPEFKDWKEDKDSFLKVLAEWRETDRRDAADARSIHQGLIIGGTVVGLGGGLGSALFNPQDTQKKIAQAAALLAGAISATTEFLQDDKEWKSCDLCARYLQQRIFQFGYIDWPDVTIKQAENDDAVSGSAIQTSYFACHKVRCASSSFRFQARLLANSSRCLATRK
jgi:hypothetical protein